jgi:hypothetical protein
LKVGSREIVLALILVLGVLGAMMASPTSNMALAATTCGVNGCVSTPPLSSSTSYSYSATSTYVVKSSSIYISTAVSSSTTSTSATTTSTSFSYTSTISTTLTTTSVSTSYTGTQTSTNTNIVTVPTTTTSGSTYTNVVTKTGPSTSCPVAFVTNGNSLQTYADFLRGFRNNMMQNTTAGREFMRTFNTWYYSWAPSLSYSAANNPWVFKAVQVGVYPLLGILYASYYSYTLVAPFSVEAAAVTAGIVAASLIGVVFIAPISYLILRITRRHRRVMISKQSVGPSIAWFTASILLCIAAYATHSGQLLGIATSSIVLSMLSLGSLIGTRALTLIQVPITNYASMALTFRRFARTLL